MSSTSSPRKRSSDELPAFEDHQDQVNAVISTLQTPDEKTNVAAFYANEKNLATEVQAYAKIAGSDWTFYVKTLAISIGRNTDNPSGSSQPLIDIDLGPAKVVSRQHATITYNVDLRCWELKVLGRNGAKIDGQKMPVGPQHATPLHLGAILEVGGTQMMFILPDLPPEILQKMLHACLARYQGVKSRKTLVGGYPQASVKNYHMYEKSLLIQLPTLALALSLQNNLDQDLSKEEAKDIKPPYSYATMITQAILSNRDGVMLLSEIYGWISLHYAYYKYSKTGWQNSIRHNLSLNKAFEKVPRRPDEPGKGMKWQISDSYKEDFMSKMHDNKLLKTRRGLLVSRQLQLHLAMHQHLPELQKYFNKDLSAPPPATQRQDSYDHRYSHLRNNSLPKLGQPMQYPNVPGNTGAQNPLSYLSNQQNYMGMPQQRQYGFQAPPPPHLMYNAGPVMAGQPQHMPSSVGQALAPVSGGKNDLSSPTHQQGDISKLSKAPGAHLFNLPPPPASHSMGLSAPQAHHSRLNSYNQNEANSFANSSNNAHSLESNPNSHTVLTSVTSNGSDLALGFTSPKKIAPLEAFTPERGSKSGGTRLGLPSGINTNQSSPAFWNFVQFSTPNAQTPMRKNSDELNGQGLPTLGRKGHDEKPFDAKPEAKDEIKSS